MLGDNIHRYSDSLVTLSRAQKRVMDSMAQGYNHTETAKRLYVSVATVRTHTKTVRRMLGVTDTDVAIVRLRGLGLLD